MSLLDKASLVQIPSGYKATKLYSVVPDSGAGDFTFARSSSGTRVNSEGLIETASVLGSELVVNGDFSTDTNWTKDSNWTIANGKATSTGVGRMFQSIPFLETNVGTKVKVSFDIVDYTSDGVVVNCYGGVSSVYSGVGSYSFITTTTNNTNLYFNNAGQGNLIGSIDNVSVKEVIENDVPRLDYSGGATCPTLLLEPQRTNQQTYSEDLTNGAWITNNSSVVPNQTTSPDGTTTADKVDYGSGSGFIRNIVTITSPATTFSIFVKFFDFQWIQIMTSGDVNHYANFDVQNGVLGNVGSSTEAEIEDYGNGWYRIVAKFVSGTFTGGPRLYKITSGTSGWASGGGDAGSYYMWGGQQEVGAFQTSYIPTTSSTVTRTQEDCNVSSATNLIGQTQGTLYAEFNKSADANYTIIEVNLNDSTGDRILLYGKTNGLQVIVSNGGTTNVNQFISYTILENNKAALTYQNNDLELYVNGSSVWTWTSATIPSSLNYIALVDNNLSSNLSITKMIALFKEILSDTELAALTTI